MELQITDHPLLECRAVSTTFNRRLGELSTPQGVIELMPSKCNARLNSDDNIRKLVRDMLRHSGFKPTGRSKPASEYLLKAAAAEKLGSINVPVDIGNVVSLHSGLPISVIDLDLVHAPLKIDVAPISSKYVFNQSGQEIDISNLICLFDQNGPCANAVKDSQRTKTTESTIRTLTIIWGSKQLKNRTDETIEWLMDLSRQFELQLVSFR